MTEKISILGSTGSIGTQALKVSKKREIKITALTAFSNVKTLEEQIREFKPDFAALFDENAAKDLKQRVSDTSTKVLSGEEGVLFCAGETAADTVLNSVVGMAGLKPTLRAAECKKNIALANKETLVAGGRLVLNSVLKNGVKLLPVDSEHSAIFQSLQGKTKKTKIKKLILTASGGPFFEKTNEELKRVKLEDALKHPNWSMGQKITVDSATMMNKGLELIEAVWLFDVSPDDIQIVIQRESILHSAVMFEDNSVIGQFGMPDMAIPIQYALTYPERYESPAEELDFAKIGKITFYEPDFKKFRCIELCRRAINEGGIIPAAVNGANEQANFMFRTGKIGFLEIAERVERVFSEIKNIKEYELKDVLEADSFARALVKQ